MQGEDVRQGNVDAFRELACSEPLRSVSAGEGGVDAHHVDSAHLC